jgi:enterobactin synthetase component D / holo-[acyl-carrier protein] synthase
VIGELLPDTVESSWSRGIDPSARLHPQEAAQHGWAVEERRREYATGRSCARRALDRLGVEPAPLLTGASREPLWPPGVVGSITHCPGYCAAAVARLSEVCSVGIDAEVHDALPEGVLELVSVPSERAWLAQAPGGVHWDRVLFSAKESVYKACFSLAGRSLDFSEAEVTLEPRRGRFDARLLTSAVLAPAGRKVTGFSGRFAVRDGLILTAIVVPGSRGGPRSAPGRDGGDDHDPEDDEHPADRDRDPVRGLHRGGRRAPVRGCTVSVVEA